MTDAVAAMRTHLRATAGVYELIDPDRIFGLELPESEAAKMPRQCVVLTLAGGPSDSSFVEVQQFRVDVWNYGANLYEAQEVQRATHDALKGLRRQRVGDTILYAAEIDSGPRSLRDQTTDWPIVIETFIVTAGECAAEAA
jgi:hypothetical protein